MRQLKGSVCVVTGAGSGIGRSLAERLAGEGAALAISDINEEALQSTAEACQRKGAQTHQAKLDVSNRQAVFEYADEVARHYGRVNVVVNNAGVGIIATVRDTSVDDYEWLMGINFWGAVYGTKAFLPHLDQAAWGHIVNISSMLGFIGVPSQSAYSASKFAIRGFTESLRQELELEGSSVSCTSVHPGGVKTNIARSALVKDFSQMAGSKDQAVDLFEAVARTSPDRVAKTIVHAIKHNRRRALVGPDAYLVDMAQRTLPTGYQLALSTMTRLAR